ncbi:MAG TPA: hypothetical protein VKV04_06625, partial [Verrucomicrobiae bacterium]|nr:hypothetical protein [Verrucomicrobiae bacterium]
MGARFCNSLLKAVFFLALSLLGLASTASAKNPTYVEFDYPNANSTNVTAINSGGTVTGMYCDVLGCHGFLRTLAGKLTSFDYPGASETQPLAIDALGRVVGIYSFFPDYLDRTFLRTPDGKFHDIDPPDAMWSITTNISPTGVVTGYYGDALYPITGERHGFEYTPGGNWTILDVPGAVSSQLQARNLPGFIVGVYDDASFASHGFLRTPGG